MMMMLAAMAAVVVVAKKSWKRSENDDLTTKDGHTDSVGGTWWDSGEGGRHTAQQVSHIRPTRRMPVCSCELSKEIR